MIENEITNALYRRTQLLVAPGAPLAGMKVWWINTPFSLPTDTYLYVTNMFNAPIRQDMRGDLHTITGLLQITVMLKENGGDPFRIATKVINHFPADLVLVEGETRVRVERRPDLGPFLQGSPHWEQPVNVHWQALVKTK